MTVGMYMNKVAAIILAAGKASRMGTLKQLLPIGEKALLERVIDLTVQLNVTQIITVIGHESAEIKRQINIKDPRFEWAENKNYRIGQSTSLQYGMKQINESIHHVMVFLGDVPFVKLATVKKIYETGLRLAAETDESFVIRPAYANELGHPVFFGHVNRDLFSPLTGDVGAKHIIRQMKRHIKLEVADAGVLHDIDTPEDYIRATDSTKSP